MANSEWNEEMSKGDLKGKRVLVTGSGTGIGKGIAFEFAKKGALVALHYSQSAEGARRAVQQIRAHGGTAEAFGADFAQVNEVRGLAKKAEDFLGGIDVLVNNAGITMNLPFERVSPEQYDILYAVNVRAPFFLTQVLLPALERGKAAAIVNISSVHAFGGRREHSVYAGTRGALVSFTRALAIELAPRGIRVNCIAPGPTEVENYYKAVPQFDSRAAGRRIPVGFIGQPWDVGKVAAFLASEEARYIVGQTIIVDGGATAWFSLGDQFSDGSPARFGTGYVPGI